MKQTAAVLTLLAATVMAASAQNPSLTCVPGAVPALVHQEGITERLGDIGLGCAAGFTAGTVSGNLTVILSVNVTNRLSGMNVLGASVSIDTPSGPPTVLSSTASVTAPNAIAFNGINIPVTPLATFNLRISGIRGNASQATSGALQHAITALLSFNGTSSILSYSPQLTVGLTSPGLLATISDTGVRFTEFYASSFQGRGKAVQEGADTGTRLIVQFSGFPDNLAVSVPNAIAGSSATTPTASGNFGLAANPGQYTPGTPGGSLLLSLVSGADSTGAGGVPVFAPTGTATITLNGSSAVTLTNGSGYAVYEVLDENPNVRESAQFGLTLMPTAGCCADAQASVSLSLAPVSTVLQADVTAPIPRFVASTPDLDCDVLGDCAANYFPHLSVDPLTVNFTAQTGSAPVSEFLHIRNTGGGTLTFTTSIAYTTGAGWLVFSPGWNKLSALPQNLPPGVYQAALTIDAGPLAGSKTVAVTFTVTSQPAESNAPSITAVVNSATWRRGPIQAGSIATVVGDRLAARPSVMFDELPAGVLFANDNQINLFVPTGLQGRTSSMVTVTTTDGVSAPFPVQIAPLAPAIFGVLNQDYSLNTVQRPALTGSVIQIFLTGAQAPLGGITAVKIHDRDNLVPVYAGPAPGVPGLQQVNVVVPGDLPAMQSEALVCVTLSPSTPRVCSLPVTIWLDRP